MNPQPLLDAMKAEWEMEGAQGCMWEWVWEQYPDTMGALVEIDCMIRKQPQPRAPREWSRSRWFIPPSDSAQTQK